MKQQPSARAQLTPPRDLVSGSTPWPTIRVPHSSRWPGRPLSTEVAIIGTGISGALIADALTDAGHDVLLIDRRQPGAGSTRASTALLQYEIDTPLSRLAEQIGPVSAGQIWRRSRLAVDALHDRVHQLQLDCDWEERPALCLDGNVLSPRGLQAEQAARRRAGFQAEYLTAAEVERVTQIRGRAALRTSRNYQCDPARLTSGLLWRAHERGARILAPFNLVALETRRNRVYMRTVDGHSISARFVIFATGYELPKIVEAKGHSVHSTWVIEVQPHRCDQPPLRHLIWEASDPYLYIRSTHCGRIVCGGADEEFAGPDARDAKLPSKSAYLQRRLIAMMPHFQGDLTRAWCGSFGGSTDGTPTMGRIPGYPLCYCVLGYGGNGITFSMLAAHLIRSDIEGRPDPDAHLFSFDRSSTK